MRRALVLALWCAACTSESSPAVIDGGRDGTGGTAGTGGATATGGVPASGGATTIGGVPASGGATTTGGTAGTSGATTTGGAPAAGGASATGGAAATGGGAGAAGCDRAGLVWKSARKTNYTSYPDPGSEECVQYNGCTWAGQFAACNGKKPESWVAAHSIAAAFPDFDALELHDFCLRSGSKTIVVTVLDTCGDNDCNGCCTRNKGTADQLIDLESYTNERWGVPDGLIEWADLGPTKTSGCN